MFLNIQSQLSYENLILTALHNSEYLVACNVSVFLDISWIIVPCAVFNVTSLFDGELKEFICHSGFERIL